MSKSNLRPILATIVALAAMFTAGAQDQMLDLSGTQMSVSNILLQIRRQTHLGVAYRTDQIDPDRMVTLPSRELSLGQALEIITKGSDLKGVIDDSNVIVFIKDTPLAATTPVASDGFVPTPLSQFRESLGLRPKSVVLDGNEPKPIQREETLVELEMPMGSHNFPASGYTANQGELPAVALKTNLLYGIGTLTPNLSFEFGLGKRTSLELGASYNPWNLKGDLESNRKLVHMIIKPEFRYWLCERFDGHFFGLHALYSRYNIGSYDVPRLFEKEYRYDGHAYGAGITYGYNYAFHKR